MGYWSRLHGKAKDNHGSFMPRISSSFFSVPWIERVIHPQIRFTTGLATIHFKWQMMKLTLGNIRKLLPFLCISCNYRIWLHVCYEFAWSSFFTCTYQHVCCSYLLVGYVVNQGNWEMVKGVEDMENITDTQDRKVGKTNAENSISRNFSRTKKIWIF